MHIMHCIYPHSLPSSSHTYQSISHSYFPQSSFHIHVFLLSFVTLSLTAAVCGTTGLELPIGTWWAQLGFTAEAILLPARIQDSQWISRRGRPHVSSSAIPDFLKTEPLFCNPSIDAIDCNFCSKASHMLPFFSNWLFDWRPCSVAQTNVSPVKSSCP